MNPSRKPVRGYQPWKPPHEVFDLITLIGALAICDDRVRLTIKASWDWHVGGTVRKMSGPMQHPFGSPCERALVSDQTTYDSRAGKLARFIRDINEGKIRDIDWSTVKLQRMPVPPHNPKASHKKRQRTRAV